MMLMKVRTKRSKKKKPRLVRGLMRYLLLFCVLFGTAFIYVRQRNTVTEMGYDLNGLREDLAELEVQHADLELEYSELILPGRIKDISARLGLNLREVDYRQKVTLTRPKPVILQEDKKTLPEDKGEDQDRRLVRN